MRIVVNLAGYLAEALITSASGLAISVMAIFAHHFLQGRCVLSCMISSGSGIRSMSS